MTEDAPVTEPTDLDLAEQALADLGDDAAGPITTSARAAGKLGRLVERIKAREGFRKGVEGMIARHIKPAPTAPPAIDPAVLSRLASAAGHARDCGHPSVGIRVEDLAAVLNALTP